MLDVVGEKEKEKKQERKKGRKEKEGSVIDPLRELEAVTLAPGCLNLSFQMTESSACAMDDCNMGGWRQTHTYNQIFKKEKELWK